MELDYRRERAQRIKLVSLLNAWNVKGFKKFCDKYNIPRPKDDALLIIGMHIMRATNTGGVIEYGRLKSIGWLKTRNIKFKEGEKEV